MLRLKRILLPAAMILAVMAAGSCASSGRGNADSDSLAEERLSAEEELEREAWAWADSATNAMSLQLRVGQLIMPAVYTTTDDATMERISDYADRLGVGGIILLKGDVMSAAQIADSVSRLAPYGLFIAVDAETGLSMRLRDAPEFLWNSHISSSADAETLFDYGRELARECRLAGVNMVLGPVLDVVDSTASARSLNRRRSFGQDPERVAELGVAYARGLEAGGVISVAKHFPGHGAAKGDSHRRLVEVDKSAEAMRAEDLLPFRKYADAGFSGIMVGHIFVPSLDSIRRPASSSPVLLKGILREELGFEGLILTDAFNMVGAEDYTALDAVKAGADIVLAPTRTERAIAEVRDAVEAGEVPESEINEHCRRILYYKYLRGVAGPRAGRSPAALRLSPATVTDTLRHGAAPVRRRLAPTQ